MPKPPTLLAGPVMATARSIARGVPYTEADFDRLGTAAGLNDADRARFITEGTALTETVQKVGTRTPAATDAAVAFAEKWHDLIGNGRSDPLRHEMDPAKLAAATRPDRFR